MNSVIAWHFLPNNRKTRYTNELVTVGFPLTCKGALSLCNNGLHACERVTDALKYAPGTVICRVELQGGILRGNDKLCARSRKVLAMADCKTELLLFAADCTERALSRIKKPDPRSLAAVQGIRDFAHGKINKPALRKLADAAWNARYDSDAAYAAAASASAAAYASDAAYAAASAAAYASDAAYAAASASAYASAAASAAAYASDAASAARNQEREWQEQELSKRLTKLLGS